MRVLRCATRSTIALFGASGVAAAVALLTVLACAGPASATSGSAPGSSAGRVIGRPVAAPIRNSATLRASIALNVTVSGHRGGGQEEPQNSLEAFGNALAEGVGEVEADTWITADGVGIIEHDEQFTAPRCSGPYLDQNVYTLTYAEVQQIQCDGQPIPTEDQLLQLLLDSTNTTTKLRLEAATYSGESPDLVRAWAKQVGDAVVAAHLIGRTIMQDFRWEGIAGFHDASPSLRVSALIVRPTTTAALQAKNLGAYDLSYNADYETPYLNEYLRSIGLVPTVYNVDPLLAEPGALTSAEQKTVIDGVERAVSAGAKVIIVNNPALVVSTRTGSSHCSLGWQNVADHALQPTIRSASAYTYRTAAPLPTYEVARLQVRETLHASEGMQLTPEGLATHAVTLHLLKNRDQIVQVGMAELNGVQIATSYPWAGITVTITGFYARSCS
ncbi:glycerophosphodiester phosphodiesterase [uncultured Jatrophihabitans sp.]|uniref:glycerophosphodiester phosphodiesterase n=1 Tax=uncultured Jatrophihabitans sp. TaxID=1610747 RepID=UPI0035CA977B